MRYSEILTLITEKECSIIGTDKYLKSAVLIPIVTVIEEEYILFEKRSLNVRQPGEVSFPGGHFDTLLDDDFCNTAVRETCEELGLTKDKIFIIGKLGSFISPMGVLIESFIGRLNISSIDEIKIDTHEVEKIFIIPLKYFIDNKPLEFYSQLEIHPFIIDANGNREELLPVKDLGLPEKYLMPWTKGKHRVLVYKSKEETIWGITAELVYELVNRLKIKIDK